jgi:hypothetical protein
MVKRIWKDRQGVIAPLTAVLVIILVIALAGMAYLALAETDPADGDDQEDEDLNGDDEEDPIIGFIEIAVKVKVYNPAWKPSDTNDDVVFTIENVDVSLIDELPTMSIWDGMEFWDGEENLKLVCTLKFPAYSQTLIKNAGHEWIQEYEGVGMMEAKTVTHHDENFYSGGIRYHGSYELELVLYEFDGEWKQCDRYTQAVSI